MDRPHSRTVTLRQSPKQILPPRIHLVNQPQLPFAVPMLDLLLPPNRLKNLRMNLVPHQLGNPVFLRKTCKQLFSMLPDTANEIRRDADV